MSGDIVQGDTLRFSALLAKLPPNQPKILLMESRGGQTIEGITLGLAIHNAKVATAVNGFCASSCALAWLGGSPRIASTHAQIGFHASFTQNGTVQSVSSVGNAEVGYYIDALGLPPEDAAYVTTADLSSALWLAPADAQQLRLNVVYIPNQTPALPPVAAPAPAYTVPATAPVAAPAVAARPPATLASAPQPMSPAQQAASTTQAYAEGHSDRVARDTWFNRSPAAPAQRRNTGPVLETPRIRRHALHSSLAAKRLSSGWRRSMCVARRNPTIGGAGTAFNR
jgi:hypothetical protein